MYVGRPALAVKFPSAALRQNPFLTRRTEPPGQKALSSASSYRNGDPVPGSTGPSTPNRLHDWQTALSVAPTAVANLPPLHSTHSACPSMACHRPAAHSPQLSLRCFGLSWDFPAAQATHCRSEPALWRRSPALHEMQLTETVAAVTAVSAIVPPGHSSSVGAVLFETSLA